MRDNIFPGGDGQANYTLGLLRDDFREGPLGPDVAFLPGMRLHSDPALELSGWYRSPHGSLLELDLRTGAKPGGWVGLHIRLPATDLRQAGFIGFAARFVAPDDQPAHQVIRACLRSSTADGFEDCFFDKHMLFRPEEATHVDALPVHQRSTLPPLAAWRELLLFLPTQSCRISFLDLRTFVA